MCDLYGCGNDLSSRTIPLVSHDRSLPISLYLLLYIA